MKVLYLSTLASQEVIKEMSKQDPNFSGFAVQKFSRLVAEGLVNNEVEVTALSTFFIPSKRCLWHHNSERENGVRYKYIPSVNHGPMRHIWLILYSFVYVFIWSLTNKKNKTLMCDVLNVSSCIGAIAAARLTGVRRVGVVTDLPGMIPRRTIKQCMDSRQMKICMTYIRHCTHYIILTQQMNEIINPYHRPYLIMEGLVDTGMEGVQTEKKSPKRIVLYAGGLREEYGLKTLVEGFIKANVENSELWIYGSGFFADDLKVYEQNFNFIKFKGVRPNQEVVESEMIATLLINPRPTQEELTQYSFPSKNMEYMVSGTPLLTTNLPGMPNEYHDYVFLFDKGETVDGFAEVMKKVLTMSDEDLKKKGERARQWVLKNKNNNIQGERIKAFINS